MNHEEAIHHHDHITEDVNEMFSILVVDDDPGMRVLFSAMDKQFSVRTASSGKEAMEMIRQQKPEFLLLDLMLPDISGEEICGRIKSDPQLSDILIFMMSSRSDLDSKLICFQLGAEDYLVKPIDIEEVEVRIRKLRDLRRSLASPPPGRTPAAEGKPKSEPAPSDKYGAYRIETLVAKGGMGSVYKAIDEWLERKVAIKVLSPELSQSQQFVERFRREAQLLAAVHHPGIAAIYTFSKKGEHHYFAMEWLEGGTVVDFLKKHNVYSAEEATQVILDCCHALEAACKRGVVHRDIKPNNIMFDAEGRVKLVDFGLALAKSLPHLTAAHEVLGTPAFMSPEQAQSQPVDHRTDIYSLGITFYLMLYGKAPFRSKTSVEVIIKHLSEPFPAYNAEGGRVPQDVYAIIQKMTAKKPEDRYQHYDTLIAELENTLRRMNRKESVSQEIPAECVIHRTSSFNTVLSKMNLSSEEGFLADRCQSGDISIDDLHLLTGFSKEKIIHFVQMMHENGAVEYRPIDKGRMNHRAEK